MQDHVIELGSNAALCHQISNTLQLYEYVYCYANNEKYLGR